MKNLFFNFISLVGRFDTNEYDPDGAVGGSPIYYMIVGILIFLFLKEFVFKNKNK